jgi:ABC-2 type transport system ATP-binding protein
MNDPELLILDEPTKGFDPVNRRLLMDIIDDQKKSGSTVMMVTHQMEEVERLCDRVILLKDGTSRAYGTVPEVQQQFGGTVVHVDHDGAIPPSAEYTIISDADGHAELEIRDDMDPSDILRTIVDADVPVRRFAPTRKSLDDIFVEVYGAENAGGAD